VAGLFQVCPGSSMSLSDPSAVSWPHGDNCLIPLHQQVGLALRTHHGPAMQQFLYKNTYTALITCCCLTALPPTAVLLLWRLPSLLCDALHHEIRSL
jgi:hypothetical protein